MNLKTILIGALGFAALAGVSTPASAMPYFHIWGTEDCFYIGEQGVYIRNCKAMGNLPVADNPGAVLDTGRRVSEASLGLPASQQELKARGIRREGDCFAGPGSDKRVCLPRVGRTPFPTK